MKASAGRSLTSIVVLVVVLVVGFVFPALAKAAPGNLDPSFSGDGKQTTNFGPGLAHATATVRQPDGKIIAVGTNDANPVPGSAFALARYKPNGSLDRSFSKNGKQTTSFAGKGGGYAGVALQPNGKIVAVGSLGDAFAVARYKPNGSLDPSFSGDGKQTTEFGYGGGANGVAIQADGKIVAVGYGGGDPVETDFAVARYRPNGSLDPSFSGDGKQTTDFGGNDFATGLALQTNGMIVVVGHAVDGDFALARYNPDGSLDPSFSGDGTQTTRVGGVANAVALQADGKIVAVGERGGGGFALARFKPNGSLDRSFAGDGIQTTDFQGDNFANGVAIQPDGKIVAVGEAGPSRLRPHRDFALARYKPGGSLDRSFSGNGKQTTDFGGGLQAANGVTLCGHGRIVAVGEVDLGSHGAFALARYKPNGSLDGSFSGDGMQTTEFGGNDFGSGVAIQANGRIVAVGSSRSRGFALARYNPNGSLDPGFSANGKQTTDFGGAGGASGVAIQADGRIVAVGGRHGVGSVYGNDFALARYEPNGSLDRSFSGNGKQTTDFAPPPWGSEARGVAIQANGRIVAVGSVSDDGFALARYKPNGSLDPSFSGDGMQTTFFGGGATAVAIQANGRIVAVGSAAGYGFALARYNPDGSLDPSFSGDGMQTTDFGVSAANGVAIQADGKIVAVGSAAAGVNAEGNFAIARYNPDGSLDPSFSGDGMQTTDFGGDDAARGVAIQPDGRIVAIGSAASGVNAVGDFAIARYNPDGSLDPSFSGDGMQTTDFGGAGGASGVALQPDGRIVAVGSGLGTDLSSDFALARYLGG